MRVLRLAGRHHRAGGFARPQRTLLHSLAMAALIMLLVASGAGVTFALWTSQATVGSAARGAQLDVTTSFAGANSVFANNVATATGSFTVSNTTDTTSTTAGTFSAALGYTGDSQLATALALVVWPQTAAPCTAAAAPSDVVATGTWASVPAIAGTLAAGSSLTYCVRMTSSERSTLATADGELLINPSVTAALTVGSWVDTASATTVQKTAYIFPASSPTANTWYQITNLGTGLCVDVHSANASSSTGVIDYACKTGNTAADYNQQWKFTATATGYYDLTPRHAQTLRMDVVGASLNSLAAIDVQTDASARVSQEWQLQRKAGNVYQLVNRLSGLCLQPNNTSVYTDVEYAQASCNGAVNQSFSLTQKAVDTPAMTLACAPAAGNGVTYSWTGAAIDAYAFGVRPGTTGSFTTVKTAPLGATSMTILPADMAALAAQGQYGVQASWNGTALAASALWKTGTAGATTLTCSAPSVPLDALTCAQNGTSVTIGWGHAAPTPYTVQRWSNGGWVTHGTAEQGAQSYTVAVSSSWSNGTQHLRVVSNLGSASQDSVGISVTKSSTLILFSHRLECIVDSAPLATAACTGGGYFLQLLWARTAANANGYAVTINGEPTGLTVQDWGSSHAVQIYPADVIAVPAGPATLRVHRNGALIVSQAITISENTDVPGQKLITCA